MSGDDDIRLRQEPRPPIGELDPNSMEYATRLLTSPEAVEGFVSGLAARQSINEAIESGDTNSVLEPPSDAPINQAQARLQSIRDGSINQYDDTVDSKGSFAKQVDTLVAKGHDLSNLEWKGLEASPDWSDDTLKGYLAGLYGGSSLPTVQLREVFAAGHTVPEAIVENGSVSLDNVLRASKVNGFSRDFGLRGVMISRFEAGKIPKYDRSGEIRKPVNIAEPVAPAAEPVVGDYIEVTFRRKVDKPKAIESTAGVNPGVAEELGEVAVDGVSRTELLPEPEAVMPESIVVASTVEPVPAEQPVKAEATPQEFQRPELKTVFANGTSLGEALLDPEVHPDIKRELSGVVRTWQEVELARTIDRAWSEVISPELRKLDDALPNLEALAGRLDTITMEIETGLGNLAQAIMERSMEGIGHATQGLNLRDRLPLLEQAANELLANDGLARAAHQLSGESEESDDLIRKSLVRSFDGDMDDESLDALAERVGPLLEDGLDLPEAIAAIRQDMPDQSVSSWRNRQEDINCVTTFARIAGNNEELSRPFKALLNDIELFSSQMRSGRYSEADAIHIRDGKLRPLREEIAMIQRMAILTRKYREAA